MTERFNAPDIFEETICQEMPEENVADFKELQEIDSQTAGRYDHAKEIIETSYVVFAVGMGLLARGSDNEFVRGYGFDIFGPIAFGFAWPDYLKEKFISKVKLSDSARRAAFVFAMPSIYEFAQLTGIGTFDPKDFIAYGLASAVVYGLNEATPHLVDRIQSRAEKPNNIDITPSL